MCEVNRSPQLSNKIFNIYEKISGRYLGHATVTANLNGDDLLAENLKFVPQQTSSLKEEYFEEEEVEQKYKNYLKKELYLGDQDDEELPDEDDVTLEGDGVLSMPMSKFPMFQDTSVSHFQLLNFTMFKKNTMVDQTVNQEQGESRPEERKD